jgi:ribosomal protein L44E
MINGRLRSLYRRRFCLSCSPFGTHNTSKSPLHATNSAQLQEQRRRRRNAKTYRSQKRRRTRRKAELVAAAGGRCVDCGYATCLWVLEFHHRDPATKEFGVGGFNGSLGRLRTEVDKCDLLCANCHRLRHAPANGFLSVDQRVQLARDKKTRAIMLMGSVCYSCDRAGPTTLFEFHHWDAREKDFGISADGLSRPWAKILAELEKCVMLCANCHREVHAGVRTIRPTLLGLAEDPAEYRAA